MLSRRSRKRVQAGRNRSGISGERPSQTFSYYTNRTPRESDRSNPTLRRLQPDIRSRASSIVTSHTVNRLPFLIAVIVIVVCVIKFSTLSTNPSVVVLDSTAMTSLYTRPNSVYESAASKVLRSSFLNNFKLTADSHSVAIAIKQLFPELETVSVTLPVIGNRPTVYVVPARPSVFMQTNSGGVFAVSKTGIALARVSEVPKHTQAPIIVDQSTVEPKLGEQVLSSVTVGFARAVAYQLSASKLSISALTLPANNAYELDLTLAGKPFMVKFNLQRDATEQVGTLLAVLHNLGQSSPPSYIDVRVPGRAYYK